MPVYQNTQNVIFSSLTVNGMQWVAKPTEPEVERTPDGRLAWKHPIPASAWRMTPTCEDQIKRSTHWKLHRKGWKGICCDQLSPWEQRRIAEFVRSREGGVYKMRPYFDEHCDQRPGDLGSFLCVSRSFLFEREEDREALLRMVNDEWPKRLIEIPVNHRKAPAELERLLRPYNWMLSVGTHGNLITIQEDAPSTVLLTLKLMLT